MKTTLIISALALSAVAAGAYVYTTSAGADASPASATESCEMGSCCGPIAPTSLTLPASPAPKDS